MYSIQNLACLGTAIGILGTILIPAKIVRAASIFTDPSLLNSPTIIDFEPLGSGNNVSDINNYLDSLGTGATFSMGGGEARIDDLSTSDRAPLFGVSSGADGGPVSGSWGFEGGIGESFLTLTFAPGHFVDAVGSFFGGVITPAARAVVTFEDGSTFTAFVPDSLPVVQDSASDAEAINGFFGVDGDGLLIQQVSFFNNNDLYSQDDVMFASKSVPEPGFSSIVLAVSMASFWGAMKKKKPNHS